jgi:hypothetical protein
MRHTVSNREVGKWRREHTTLNPKRISLPQNSDHRCAGGRFREKWVILFGGCSGGWLCDDRNVLDLYPAEPNRTSAIPPVGDCRGSSVQATVIIPGRQVLSECPNVSRQEVLPRGLNNSSTDARIHRHQRVVADRDAPLKRAYTWGRQYSIIDRGNTSSIHKAPQELHSHKLFFFCIVFSPDAPLNPGELTSTWRPQPTMLVVRLPTDRPFAERRCNFRRCCCRPNGPPVPWVLR